MTPRHACMHLQLKEHGLIEREYGAMLADVTPGTTHVKILYAGIWCGQHGSAANHLSALSAVPVCALRAAEHCAHGCAVPAALHGQ